ncbi:hypothetical protein O7626_09750 [Micromonospora sp. WMMD1102]|uniref:hypothetical protein n=1 Tax=Micromonospora sp. WMMD1102 TaxID=3016105 RepID=UPI002414FAE9|nr:hypothetical protein [Micromonospora sp. WMMD1102]MDG4786206.1 hypothetical protein [Micromonospora sp. WMMD1102]
MRRAGPHPVFIVLLLLSFVGLIVAPILVAWAIEICMPTPGEAHDPNCQYEADGVQTLAIVTAIGSLTTMLGAVGFQVGRNVVAAAPVAPAGFVPPVPGPPPGPGRPTYAPAGRPVSGSGQPPG